MDKIIVELITGCEGDCISINDHRICGPKPWGGGKITQRWKANSKDILEALGTQEKIDVPAQLREIRQKARKVKYALSASAIYATEIDKLLADLEPDKEPE